MWCIELLLCELLLYKRSESAQIARFCSCLSSYFVSDAPVGSYYQVSAALQPQRLEGFDGFSDVCSLQQSSVWPLLTSRLFFTPPPPPPPPWREEDDERRLEKRKPSRKDERQKDRERNTIVCVSPRRQINLKIDKKKERKERNLSLWPQVAKKYTTEKHKAINTCSCVLTIYNHKS